MSLPARVAPQKDGRRSPSHRVPNVVVVDPRFDAYKTLAASARLGRIGLHFRSSGSDAVRLARRLEVDAWLIAADLDDMSGHDLVQLLKLGHDDATADGPTDSRAVDSVPGDGLGRIAIVETAPPGGRHWTIAETDAAAVGADAVMSHPISLADLDNLLGLSAEERSQVLAAEGHGRPFVTLPVGVGAAVIAILVLAMG